MQKTKSIILTALLLSAMTLAIFPMANASTGFITVLTVPATIPAGGNIDLNFAGVTWSGGQFYLILSTDGFSQVSPADLRFTPSFAVSDLIAVTTRVITDPTGTYPGSWTIGNNQITGSIPSAIAGGAYYIKAFDGLVTSLAVTSPAFTVIASLSVTPTTGAAGTTLTIRGNAFPVNALVNLSYVNPVTAAFVTVQNLTQAGSIGNVTWVIPAPDVIGPVLNVAGDNAVPASNAILFRATENRTAATYDATYTEMQRGLLQFGRPRSTGVTGSLQNATGLYGNLTSFAATVSVGVSDNVRIAGNWFYPGNLTIKWDNAIDITPASRTANGTGYFNTTVVVPGTGLGVHNITIVDANNVVFAVFLNVVQTIIISPTSGPIGTVVTINGYGFPASAGTTVYNATITFDATARGWALTDANGAFMTTITVPLAAGGAHTITATTNDTALTAASRGFTIGVAFAITPTSFYANDTSVMVNGKGTGFDPATSYFVALDNIYSPFTNTTGGIVPGADGNLTFQFVAVGFQPGIHVVALYQSGTGAGANAPFVTANFTVLGATNDLLTAINNTVVAINSTVNTSLNYLKSINATVIAINGNTATLSTSIGTLTTTISSLQSTLGSLQSSVSGLSGSLSSISSGIATIQTNLGTVQTAIGNIDPVVGLIAGDTTTIKTTLGTITTSLSSIGTTVTSISGDQATIKTDLGTISGTVTSVKDGVATIQTSLGTMQTSVGNLQSSVNGVKSDVAAVQSDVGTVKGNTNSLSPLIIVAIVLALIAAIAAIASIFLMRKKIAG